MRVAALLLAAASTQAINVLLSNDDGWAEANVREQFTSLVNAGFSVVLSAPAENKSGTGSTDQTPSPRTTPCEFNSCPAGTASEGFNASDTRLNWVNSFPVTSVKFGIQTLSPHFFGGPPDIIVAGPNVGSNLGSTVLISGTVGAATEGAKEGVPSLAFSGSTGSQVSYTTLPTSYSGVYAALSTTVTSTIVDSGKPFLPAGIALNVNFPSVSGSCTTAGAFHFVLSRINSAASGAAADVRTCGSTRLPTESSVVGTSGCFVSISVMNATNKGDVAAATQQVVLTKLSSILSCLP
ncbi:putative acid phosphatase [Exidia glandulosa HHB12029]|uniref:Putative acid phosphatase n=1 Tax=Exidia glandulosa HHB12029 TaxID=1314781 RepID=A0A165KLL8_EXIGL|nr:putative acid phosphatase [Exidia glandulosa HHB12029]